MVIKALSRTDPSLVYLPESWSNRGRKEQLDRLAAESLSNALNVAVADTGTNFQIFDALRPIEEQKEIFFDRYERTNWSKKRNSSDRVYEGSIWRKVKGANAAAPGSSTHGPGLAIDIHPGPIQEWFKTKGAAWGWSWEEGRENGEDWHFTFTLTNQYASRGMLDHGAVQKVVGAEVDSKIGTDTVEKIRVWQREHGLTADGIVGPVTKSAMGLGEEVLQPTQVIPPSSAGGFTYTYTREAWDTQGIADGVHAYDMAVQGIYIHWPGAATKFHGMTAEQTAAVLREYRRDHTVGKGWRDIGYGAAVDWAGRTYQLRGLDMEVGSNGGDVSNSSAGSILYLCGTGEKPTPEMIAAGNGLLAQYGDRYGQGFIRGHRESPDASTTCPGDVLMSLIGTRQIRWSGAGIVVDGEAILDSGRDHVVVDGRFGYDTGSELQRRLGVKVDGRAAEDTWTALQRKLNAPHKDGQISRQSYRAKELGNGVVDRKSAWEYTGRGSKGSQTVKLLQKAVGVKADGIWFEGTTKALQRKMNADPNFLRG